MIEVVLGLQNLRLCLNSPARSGLVGVFITGLILQFLFGVHLDTNSIPCGERKVLSLASSDEVLPLRSAALTENKEGLYGTKFLVFQGDRGATGGYPMLQLSSRPTLQTVLLGVLGLEEEEFLLVGEPNKFISRTAWRGEFSWSKSSSLVWRGGVTGLQSLS